MSTGYLKQHNNRYQLCALTLALLFISAMPDAMAAKGGKPPGGGNTSSCKINDSTDVAIYIGGGTGASSRLWAEALIDFWKTGARKPGDSTLLNAGGDATWGGDADLDYVTLTLAEFNACSASDFNKLALFFMPGGSAYEIQDNLGASGKSKLTSFLDQGGNYVGICAGGYYAARGYYWKGDDGAPTDNCKNQFCRYETGGTFSYDTATKDFTRHEWNGTSYHSNLLAYGPLANVYVEGPIEEIAGPWNADSNPNHPYDSHLIDTQEPDMPLLRVVYWGGATENYIYTDTNPETSGWPSNPAPVEHAHFAADSAANNDLPFPQDKNLWALKSVETASGGTIMISSAHVEASLFHTASTFENGGMTECQQYNNYTYMVRKMNAGLTPAFATVPDYDYSCEGLRNGEVKQTADLFPALAYATAPRIDTSGGGNGGGGGGDNSATGFDGGTLGLFKLIGFALRPWTPDSAAACDGTAYGARAGHSGGVDFESVLSIQVPEDTTEAGYRYSYPSALDSGDDFHVVVNGQVVHSYETGDGADCATGQVAVNPGDTLQFRCRSGGNGETCSIDQVEFR